MDCLTRIRAYDLSLDQLNRVHDLRCTGYFHIIHIQYDDLTDHYVTLVECDDRLATWIALL
jgi:hypothetical protein